jgi:hypothetical protein
VDLQAYSLRYLLPNPSVDEMLQNFVAAGEIVVRAGRELRYVVDRHYDLRQALMTVRRTRGQGRCNRTLPEVGARRRNAVMNEAAR